MKTLVIHHNDPDGIASGLVAKKYLATKGDSVETVMVNYGMPAPENQISRANRVIIVDFSFPVGEMTRLATTYARVHFTVVDHHERVTLPTLSNVEGVIRPGGDLPPTKKVSGVDMTMDIFPIDLSDSARTILRAIGRRDVWDFSDETTDPIVTAVYSYPQTIESYESVIFGCEDVSRLVEQGRAIIRYRTQCIQASIRLAEPVEFAGIKAMALNTPFASSETGNLLAQKSFEAGNDPIGITYVWDPVVKQYRFSLRSIGTTDVAAIARIFGGGGHRNAAGFVSATIPWAR